jgi:hypothetical protein
VGEGKDGCSRALEWPLGRMYSMHITASGFGHISIFT